MLSRLSLGGLLSVSIIEHGRTGARAIGLIGDDLALWMAVAVA